jgi:1A family penicillin-binding protein
LQRFELPQTEHQVRERRHAQDGRATRQYAEQLEEHKPAVHHRSHRVPLGAAPRALPDVITERTSALPDAPQPESHLAPKTNGKHGQLHIKPNGKVNGRLNGKLNNVPNARPGARLNARSVYGARTGGQVTPRPQSGARLAAMPRPVPALAASAARASGIHPAVLFPILRRSNNRNHRRSGRGKAMSIFLNVFISLSFVGLLSSFISTIVTAGGIFFGYMAVVRELDKLPSADLAAARAAAFQSVFIYDRNGALLYEMMDPTGGRRIKINLDEVAPLLIEATIATEDKDFYENPGYDVYGMVRAAWQNLDEGGTVSGASTVTQQLARALLLSEDERTQITVERKLKEVYLAAEISRRYTKEEIMTMYLNEVYYGNLAYGIEAASQTYFNKHANELNLAEASLLAGLPQAPSVHDPIANPDGALTRQKQVLGLMVEEGYVTRREATAAADEMEERIHTLQPPSSEIKNAPHFVNYVRQVLEEQYGAQAIYRGGFRVKTTLDPNLQAMAEEIVRTHVESLANRNVTNGALVALDPRTGEILAMVGSKDYYNEAIDGEVNVTIRMRQPGSSIKPVTYLAAFENGWTPATIILDIPSKFKSGPDDYKPVNYDGKFHGPVTVRQALANSYNVPAVKAVNFVGLEKFLETAGRLGINTYGDPSNYGLSITLGGGELRLLDLTGAYATFANLGVRVPHTPILEVARGDGEVVWRHEPAGEQVIRPQHAFLLTSILSDNAARAPAFGANSPLTLPGRPVAAKTGTTNDFRDNLTLGYTPELAVGVWVGNFDNAPMHNVTGITGAAPIWNEFMRRALEGQPPTNFPVPPGIVQVNWRGRAEFFAEDQLPKRQAEEDIFRACGNLDSVTDVELRKWLEQNCPKPTPQPPAEQPTPQPTTQP